MSLIAFSAAVILLWLMASPSSGQVDEFFSGNKLPEICAAGGQGSDTGSMFCVGYISGVRDVLSPPKQEICMPDDVVLAKMQAAIVDFLRDNSELRDFGAAGLVKKALALKYPCTKKL
jgi:hypothetical protein